MDIRLTLLATELFRSIRITWGDVLIFTVLIMQRSFTSAARLAKPMNTVHFIGDRMKMECSSNSSMPPVDWEFALAGSSDFSLIYTAGRITGSLSSRYKIDTDGKTRYDIVIDSVDSSHAGTYRCTPITEEVINASSYTAQLIVLGSAPVCGTNASASNGGIVEGDYIRIGCTVNYTGNWIPLMDWTRKDGQTIDTVIIYRPTNTSITSSLTIQLNSSDNEVTFTCITSFKPTSTMISRTLRPGEGHATNFPHYQHLWNFTADVLYAPRNLTIMHQDMSCLTKRVYEVGDHLVCWANGNPTPTYEWIEIETNRTIHGSILIIDNYLRTDQNHSFRCKANNTVAGIGRQIAETITFTVKGRSQLSTGQSIIISIIAVGTACCLVLTLYLCRNRCPYKRGTARPEPDILQAVQINPYDIAESLEDRPTDRLRSVQAVHPTGALGGNSQHQPPLPVYSEVHRKENNDELHSGAKGATGYLPRHQGLPVYTEVVKNRKGSKNSDGPRQTVEATAAQCRMPPRTLTGADGTQYMDVTSIRDLNARAPIRHLPLFSVVETYASIDHTVDAPPPLPPKRQ